MIKQAPSLHEKQSVSDILKEINFLSFIDDERTHKSTKGPKLVYSDDYIPLAYDKYGISYTTREKDFVVCQNIPSSSLPSFGKIISKLSNEGYKIIIPIENAIVFNNITESLNNNTFSKEIILNFHEIKLRHPKTALLKFELLPQNVKVSNNYMGQVEVLYSMTTSSEVFDHWCLWLNNEDFEEVSKHLTDVTRDHMTKMRKIALEFYKLYTSKCNAASDFEKTEFAFEWCRRNIPYDGSAIRKDGNLKDGCFYAQDAVATFEHKKGVCAGQAKLMKILLNNPYMKVECYTATGMKANLPHQWNEVFINGIRTYYDLSYEIKACDDIENKNYILESHDYVPNELNIHRKPLIHHGPKLR